MLESFPNKSSHASPRPAVDGLTIQGVAKAIEFARGRRIISAIKHLERSNPGLSRDRARALVESWGYGQELRWPEEDKQPLRCL